MDPVFKTYLSQHLLEQRNARGLTQMELAKLSDIPRSTIANLESGNGNPSVAILYKLAKTLGITMEMLITPRHPPISLIKAQDLKTTSRMGGDAIITKILPMPIPHLVIDKFELAVNARIKGTPHPAYTREYFHLLKGHMSVIIENTSYEIGPGDVLTFPGDVHHSYENIGRIPSLGISVVSLN